MNADSPGRRSLLYGELVLEGSSEAAQTLRLDVLVTGRAPLVLLAGEYGVGKEAVARAVLRNGAGDTAVTVVDCRTLDADSVATALVGCVGSAFAGAVDRMGLLETGEHGALYLEEIAALPPLGQQVLARAVATGLASRVGSRRSFRIARRIVCSSSRDLAREAAEGRLQNDLYYQLASAVSVSIPRLRDRAVDIPPLASRLLREGDSAASIDLDALDALAQYHWPGNLCELVAVVDVAGRMRPAGRVNRGDIEHAIGVVAAPGDRQSNRQVEGEGMSFQAATDAVRRQVLIEALEATAGNQTIAGIRLGMHVRSGETEPSRIELRHRKLAHRKFRYWWDRLVGPDEKAYA